MSHDLNLLAGAYALDALSPEEREQFQAHLAECPECTDEVRGMQRTAAELSQITAVEPPPQLREDVLRGISQVRPLPPVVDNVIALRRAKLSRSVWQGLAAACLVLAVAAGGWGYTQHRNASRASSANPVAAAVSSLANQPNADLVVSSTALSHGSGTVIWAKQEHKVVLIGRDMPALPAGKTYQLWMLPETGKAVSAGVFQPDAAGNVAYQTDGDLSGYVKMGVSVEPAGGSAQPTPSTVQLLNI
ncbi:MAG TPA: anti-sigma factor [Jatrophihabitans sp.]|nr:anti-sigma factor [Jatrophihabitans sp.]